MAQINITIPEPSQEYRPENQRQILEALDTLKNQLNFGFREDLRQEVERLSWFYIRSGC